MRAFAKSVLGLAALASAVLAFPAADAADAAARQLCLVRGDAVKQLAERYGEGLSARGLSQDGKRLVEIFSGPSGSWTVVVTDVAGRSCVIASGQAWSAIAPERAAAPAF